MVRMIAGKLIEKTSEVTPGTVVVNPTVTWNPSASPVEITLRTWNRDFAEGTLEAWTYVNAELSTEDPHEGDFCVHLKESGAYILQTLDEPVPVYAVYEFSCWLKRPNGVSHSLLVMHHTDGTTNEVGGSLVKAGWQRMYFSRSNMNTSKILSAVSIESLVPGGGQLFVDQIFLGIASEVIAGSVESLQAIPSRFQAEVIARPMGMEPVRQIGKIDTTAAYQTVVSYMVIEGWKLELAKILISCPEDVMYQLLWDDEVISAEVYVTGGIPLTDWFPWEYKQMWGDSEKEFEIQVKYPTGGATGECHVEMVGEYVPYTFNPRAAW